MLTRKESENSLFRFSQTTNIARYMANFSNLEGPSAQRRELILFLVGDSTKSRGTSANYYTTDEHEIYVICNYVVYIKFIELLITKDATAKVTVVVAYANLEELLELTRVLYQLGSDEKKQLHQKQWYQKHSQYLRPEEDYEQDSEIAFEVSPGQADKPLAVQTVFLIDDEIMERDHLTPQSIAIQQILRFVALKHAASFVIITGLSSLISNEIAITSFVQKVYGSKLVEPISVYEDEGLKVTESIYVNTLIPLGWETWARIELLAKSGFHSGTESAKLLSSEDSFAQLNQLYNAYLGSGNSEEVVRFLEPVPEVEPEKENDTKKSHTLSQLLVEVQNDHYYD